MQNYPVSRPLLVFLPGALIEVLRPVTRELPAVSVMTVKSRMELEVQHRTMGKGEPHGHQEP